MVGQIFYLHNAIRIRGLLETVPGREIETTMNRYLNVVGDRQLVVAFVPPSARGPRTIVARSSTMW